MDNETWKEEGHTPTREDITKYINTQARLLILLDYYAAPFEARITMLSSSGNYIQINDCTWLALSSFRVLEHMGNVQVYPSVAMMEAIGAKLRSLPLPKESLNPFIDDTEPEEVKPAKKPLLRRLLERIRLR